MKKQNEIIDIQIFKKHMISELVRYLNYMVSDDNESVTLTEDEKLIIAIERRYHELIHDGEYDPWIEIIANEEKQTPSVMD